MTAQGFNKYGGKYHEPTRPMFETEQKKKTATMVFEGMTPIPRGGEDEIAGQISSGDLDSRPYDK